MSYETTIIYLFSIAQIALLLFAAYFAHRIYTFNRIANVWLAVPIALTLLAFRQTLTLFKIDFLENLFGQFVILDTLFIPLLISIFLAQGMWVLAKSFENFDVVERNVEDKVKNFSKTKKKK